MLRLDITWLLGTAFLARDPSNHLPDWPPEPDRIFSALVASWGAGGELATERAALEWLEACAPPVLCGAAKESPRPAPTVFVPPNDSGISDIAILPERRRRQPRRFPAVTLDCCDASHLALVWAEEPAPDVLAALGDLAARTSYVGHSSSLVRCRFSRVDSVPDDARPARRAPYPGRLAELEALHERHMRGGVATRPRPSTRAGFLPCAAPRSPRAFATAPHWTVFEHAGGERPDLRAAAILCDTLRRALMGAWHAANGEPIPGWIVGHEADGKPARDAHMAIVPLAHLGFQHSDARLMGLAIVPPAAIVEAWAAPGPDAFSQQRAFARAIARLGDPPVDGDGGAGRVLTLAGARPVTWSWRLRGSVGAGSSRSLDPRRYAGEDSPWPSARWASATPVLLDRHLKSDVKTDWAAALDEASQIVREACARIGLPRPAEVQVSKHSAVRGAPPAWPVGGSPAWQGWSRKASFGQRQLFHVTLGFDEPIHGPVLIGAGRFVGLGLCLPVGGAA
jgi:CRISPR-associated protein Csb2